MTKTDDLMTQLQEITKSIEAAQLQLQSGQIADLSETDAKIAEICDETMRLPPAEAMKIQPIMADMIGKLETFGLALKDFKNSFQQS